MNSVIPITVHWQGKTRDHMLVAASVTDDLVISVGLLQSKLDRTGYLHAWERASGRLRWSYGGSMGTGIAGGILGTPIIEGKRMWVAGGRGALICMDLLSGRVQWEKSAGGAVVVSPVKAGNQVYFASESGNLIAMAPDMGQERWIFRIGSAIRANPVIKEACVIVCCWDGHLYAVSPDGELVWKFGLASARPTAVEICGDHLVLFDTASGDLRSVAMIQETATWRVEEKWRHPTGQRSGVRPVPSQGTINWVNKASNRIVCMDAANGKINWTARTGNAPLTPVVDGRRIIVACRDGRIAVFDLNSGDEIWRAETGIPISSEMAFHDSAIYVGSSDRMVYALAVDPQAG